MAAPDQEPHASAVRPRSYQDKSYLHGFLGTVEDLQKTGVLQDVVLEVEGRRFPCHRLVLSAASPYFRAMFTSDMAESRQKTVVLQGLDAGMFGEILSYIYSGTLHVSLDKVQPLYQAADLLQLDYVRDTCSSYMVENVKVESSNCVDLYKFADVFSVDTVLNRCQQWIIKHFTEVASSEEFCSLSVNQLIEIVSHDQLDVKEETTVWEAVVRWVQHSREDRQHHLPSILPHIRFNLLTSDDTAAILQHPLVREDPGSSVIRNVIKETANVNKKRRVGMDSLEMALLFSTSTSEMLWMNPEKGKYIRCHYNIAPIVGTVTSDNDIYVLAKDSDRKHALFKYNHIGNKWKRKSSVRRLDINCDYPPSDFLMEIDGDLFYVVVISPGPNVVLRKYNQFTNKWHTVPHTSSTPQHDGWFDPNVAVCCNRHIYVFTHTEIHRYDPRTDQWCRKAYQMEFPVVCTAVVMGTEIFFTDNRDKLSVYDTELDTWRVPPGLLNADQVIEDVTLFVIQNKLHALIETLTDSSTDEVRIEVRQVFVYDRCESVWRELFVLPDGHLNRCELMIPVARMYLPYLNHDVGTVNPEGGHDV
ncbi:kelch repeat and BTB domain-containing protein 8-like isoform X3 [Branchiostoma lanceolatum]|uniref:kelch repeat and BTB domain-containing protein 8-like isoform X3 n=1 Tax=Branchiostoma lanceolatum TaxID=7740 RepID=UPI00345453B0